MAIRTYQEHIDAEKYKLLDGLPLCPLFSSECLLNEIEKRQQNLTNRMIYAIQCQMPSFIRHTAPERGLAIERDPTDFSLTSRFE